MDQKAYRNLHLEEYRKYQARYRRLHAEQIAQYRKHYVINTQSPRLKKRYRNDPAYREFRKASSQRRYYERRIEQTQSLIDQGDTTPANIEALAAFKQKRQYYRDIELSYKLNGIK